MPLITCPDCQRPVSQYAPACPNCGRPIAPQAQPAPWRAAPVDRLAGEKQTVQIAYGLWAVSYLVGIVGIAALIMCYIKRGDARGTYLAAHYDWMIETFWFTVLGVIGGIVIVVGMMAISEVLGIFAAVALVLFAFGWPIYRLVKGWTALNDGRVPETPDSPW